MYIICYTVSYSMTIVTGSQFGSLSSELFKKDSSRSLLRNTTLRSSGFTYTYGLEYQSTQIR